MLVSYPFNCICVSSIHSNFCPSPRICESFAARPASLKAKLSRRRHKTALIRSLVRLLPPCIARSLAYSIDDVIEVVYPTRLVAVTVLYRGGLNYHSQVVRMMLASSGKSGQQQQEQSSPTMRTKL